MASQSPGSSLVTGEAVIVDLRIAKLPSRTTAFMIDALLQLAALLGLTFLLGALADSVDGTLMMVLAFVTGLAILVGYPVGMETLTRGRTVGKLALGLRVTRDDGGAIRFRHALARGLSAVVEIFLTFGAIAVLVCLISPEGKRVGDYLAGTVVVRERAPRRETFTPWLDPQLAPWADTLDLGRLDEVTALAVRQFLVRAPALAPAARQRLAATLCAEVRARVTPPPPAGVPSEVYLNAVLAERQRRPGADVPPGAPAAPVRTTPPETPVAPADPGTPVDQGWRTDDGFVAPS